MKIREIAMDDARFLLKSEYGPLSSEWPVVAFTNQSSETQIRRRYRNGRDFVVYLGTQDEKTFEASDRGRLLSICEIDTTRIFNTYDYITKDSRDWAEKKHPNQWLRSFRVIRGFDVPSRPAASELLPNTNRSMWHAAFREVAGSDRESLMDLDVNVIPDVDILSREDRKPDAADFLRPENRSIQQEALRLAQLVYNRVGLSGETITHRAPERSAPFDLQLQIFRLLMAKPLTCALCGGEMQIAPQNKLLKISGDRRNSSIGDYGPDNYQLVHFACNLAKNNASEAEFFDWLDVIRQADGFEEEHANVGA